MAHAHCMLDTQGYKHTHKICNVYCCSTAIVVVRKHLNIMLYVHCLPILCSVADLIEDSLRLYEISVSFTNMIFSYEC